MNPLGLDKLGESVRSMFEVRPKQVQPDSLHDIDVAFESLEATSRQENNPTDLLEYKSAKAARNIVPGAVTAEPLAPGETNANQNGNISQSVNTAPGPDTADNVVSIEEYQKRANSEAINAEDTSSKIDGLGLAS